MRERERGREREEEITDRKDEISEREDEISARERERERARNSLNMEKVNLPHECAVVSQLNDKLFQKIFFFHSLV